MKNLLHSLFTHVLKYREVYVFPVIAVLLIIVMLLGVPLLTGRAVTDQPDAIAGFIYNLVGVNCVVLLVGLVQPHLIGYRSSGQGARLRDDIFDALCTIVLLALFSHYLFR